MTFNEYQDQAARTSATGLAISGLGIAGEAGEVADMIKKHLGHGHDLDIGALAKELGDVLWYIADLATATGISLGMVAQMNLDKLAVRYPNGFDPERSRNRASFEVC